MITKEKPVLKILNKINYIGDRILECEVLKYSVSKAIDSGVEGYWMRNKHL